jgi:hypothetical protein
MKFSFSITIHNSSGANPVSYSMGTRDFFSGGKQVGPEGDYLLPSSAELKNERSCASASLCTFVAWKRIDF